MASAEDYKFKTLRDLALVLSLHGAENWQLTNYEVKSDAVYEPLKKLAARRLSSKSKPCNNLKRKGTKLSIVITAYCPKNNVF
jgi:hypothetical protein